FQKWNISEKGLQAYRKIWYTNYIEKLEIEIICYIEVWELYSSLKEKTMNKIFKVVWNKSKNCYVVVSEFAKNNSGKKK
ncbi:hypothetical protein Q604_UNBc4C00136G0001, partial [human gut metagenome]